MLNIDKFIQKRSTAVLHSRHHQLARCEKPAISGGLESSISCTHLWSYLRRFAPLLPSVLPQLNLGVVFVIHLFTSTHSTAELDPFNYATIVHSDPYQAFTTYLRSRDHLFPYRYEVWLCSNDAVPIRTWFLRRPSKTFPLAANMSDHSMPAGGAPSLAISDLLGDTIRSIDRWSSSSGEIYVRKHPAIIHALLQASTVTA